MQHTQPKSKRHSGDGTRTRRSCPDAMLGSADRAGDLFSDSPRENASDAELMDRVATVSDELMACMEILDRRLQAKGGAS